MGNERERFEKQYLIFLSDEQFLRNPTMAMAPLQGQWVDTVLADLSRVESNPIGNLLLRSIAFHGHTVWITPYNHDPSACQNAQTGPTDDHGAVLMFTPALFLAGHPLCKPLDPGRYGFVRPSFQMLFHELVHALRFVSGKNLSGVGLGKGLVLFGNKEEFIAVVVEGIFSSSRGAPVRASHRLHYEIDAELSGDFKFFQIGTEAYKYIKEFCLENPGFTLALACLNSAFNPIRAYYGKPALAKSISERSALAAQRDRAMPMAKANLDILRNVIDTMKAFQDNLKRGIKNPWPD